MRVGEALKPGHPNEYRLRATSTNPVLNSRGGELIQPWGEFGLAGAQAPGLAVKRRELLLGEAAALEGRRRVALVIVRRELQRQDKQKEKMQMPDSWRRWRRLIFALLGGDIESHPGPRREGRTGKRREKYSEYNVPIPAAAATFSPVAAAGVREASQDSPVGELVPAPRRKRMRRAGAASSAQASDQSSQRGPEEGCGAEDENAAGSVVPGQQQERKPQSGLEEGRGEEDEVLAVREDREPRDAEGLLPVAAPVPAHSIRREQGVFKVISVNTTSLVKPSTQEEVLSWRVDAQAIQEAKADQQALVNLGVAAALQGWHLTAGKPLQRQLVEQEDGRRRSTTPWGGAVCLSCKHVQAEPLTQLEEDELLLWDSKRFASIAHPLEDGRRFCYVDSLYLPSGDSYEAQQERSRLLEAYFRVAKARKQVPMVLCMDANPTGGDLDRQTELVAAREEGWCDAAELQQRQDGRALGPTYSENSTWAHGVVSRIDVFYLNGLAAAVFKGYAILSSLDIKKHRPLLLELQVSNLEQLISTAKVPQKYPVGGMRRMKPAEEEMLGRQEVSKQREAIEGCHRQHPPDTKGLFSVLNTVAESYLARRTKGAGGKPGKPGRGGAPELQQVPL